MAIADLSSVLKIFGESSPSDEEQNELYGEALLMTLARASSSDANIDPAEISTIQQIVQRETGEEVSSQDVRRAARTELYETTPLRKYLRSVQRELRPEDRRKIVQALAEVIKSDCKVSVLEIDFFNRVADALRITPAELVGLHG
jgi:uncharacterized tellurite resistance protein B-like protein